MQQSRDDLNTPKIVLIGIISALLIFIIIVAVQAWFYHYYEQIYQERVVNQESEELKNLRANQQEILNSYRWIDQDNNTVAIPIDRAMELVLEDQNQNQ